MITAPFASLLHNKESEEHEFFLRFDKGQIAKTVCAFLNGKGGRLVVGADDRGTIAGLKDPAHAVAQIDSYLQENVLPIAVWSASIEKSNDRASILVVDVPPGTSKPYLINGQIWCRHNDTTTPATPEDVSQIIKDRVRADDRWERRIALGVNQDDLDQTEILRAAKEIQSTGRHKFANPDDPLLVLSELALQTDGQFTNAAVVLFGKYPTAIFPQASVRVTIYDTDKKGKELPFDELLASHLFATLDRAIEIVRSKVGVASEFHDDDLRRSDGPIYPFWSLREGLLNALVHRDLASSSGSASISIYPDQIKMWNRGDLPKGWKVSDLIKDHPSLPRNPDIAHVCFLRGLIEKLGRGTQLVVREFERLGLQKPVWESGVTGTTLTFMNKQASRKKARQILNQRQLAVLEKLKVGDRITVGEYLDMVGKSVVSERTVRTDLNGLMDAGLLKRGGQGKNTFYERTERGWGI